MALHLVTGGSGFVGSHTAEYLLDKGEDVRIFDRVPPDIPGTDLLDRVDFHEGDIRDSTQVNRAVEGVDYVHHNVALVPLSKAGSAFWDVNVGGTKNVVQAGLDAGIDGLTHISSSAVYDLSHMPVTEESPLDPIGQYGHSKLAADRVVSSCAARGLNATILRPRTVLDVRRAGIYQILFDWIDRGTRIYMLGDGDNEFQLISARDLADASYRAAVRELPGKIYNIGNREYNTLGTDLRHLVDYAGSNSAITWIPAKPVETLLAVLDTLRVSPLAPWHYRTVYRDYYFDIAKAEAELEWHPTDGNFTLFERAYDWYRTHPIDLAETKGSVHRRAPRQKILRWLRWLS